MVLFESLCTISYSCFIATMAVSLVVSEIFNVKEWRDLDLEIRERGHSQSLEVAPFDSSQTSSYWLSIGTPAVGREKKTRMADLPDSVKKVWEYHVYSCRQNTQTWRADRHPDGHRITERHRPRLCIHCVVKGDITHRSTMTSDAAVIQ